VSQIIQVIHVIQAIFSPVFTMDHWHLHGVSAPGSYAWSLEKCHRSSKMLMAEINRKFI
jgi:hypothetical protein